MHTSTLSGGDSRDERGPWTAVGASGLLQQEYLRVLSTLTMEEFQNIHPRGHILTLLHIQ